MHRKVWNLFLNDIRALFFLAIRDALCMLFKCSRCSFGDVCFMHAQHARNMLLFCVLFLGSEISKFFAQRLIRGFSVHLRACFECMS